MSMPYSNGKNFWTQSKAKPKAKRKTKPQQNNEVQKQAISPAWSGSSASKFLPGVALSLGAYISQHLPAAAATPVRQALAGMVNLTSNWTETNSTTYCQDAKPKDIESTCFSYALNAAQAAVDVVWKYTDPDYHQWDDMRYANSEEMYNCVKDFVSQKVPEMLAKYSQDPQTLTDLCAREFMLKGYSSGLSAGGYTDKVHVFPTVLSDLTTQMCQEFQSELETMVKEKCGRHYNNGFDIDWHLVGYVVAGVAAFAICAAGSKVAKEKFCPKPGYTSIN
jgi:hypothetical protein